METIGKKMAFAVDCDLAPYSNYGIGYIESFCRLQNVMRSACRGGEINE